jgi:hypothetical protein
MTDKRTSGVFRPKNEDTIEVQKGLENYKPYQHFKKIFPKTHNDYLLTMISSQLSLKILINPILRAKTILQSQTGPHAKKPVELIRSSFRSNLAERRNPSLVRRRDTYEPPNRPQ